MKEPGWRVQPSHRLYWSQWPKLPVRALEAAFFGERLYKKTSRMVVGLGGGAVTAAAAGGSGRGGVDGGGGGGYEARWRASQSLRTQRQPPAGGCGLAAGDGWLPRSPDCWHGGSSAAEESHQRCRRRDADGAPL